MVYHNIQPVLDRSYKKAVSAKGVFIYDEDGKAYLDGSSGAVACSIGHSHPRLIPWMQDQLERLQYVHRSQFGSNEAETLARKLFQISPNGEYQHTFFVGSGSEAVETAMKICIQYWQEQGVKGKNKFISRRKSYHGMTLGALSVTGHQKRRSLFEESLISYPQRLHADLETDNLETHLQELDRIVSEIGNSRMAGIVLEPIIGAAGTALIPPEGYYQAIRSFCDDQGILLIADEVMTGLGRTGEWFAMQHWETIADIVAVGKSLGAGYAPIAATLMRSSVLDPIKNGSGYIMSGHTYSGHPFSCSTALRVLDIIEEENLMENVQVIGSQIKDALYLMKEKHDFIQRVRGKGLLLGMEFDVALRSIQTDVIDRCFDNGLLVYPSVGGPEGSDENGILISPPFITNKEEAVLLLEKLDYALVEVGRNL